MAIILDADVIIRGEKGTFDLQRWVVSRPDEQFEVAAVTVAELWHGVERATGTHKGKRARAPLGGIGIVRQDDRLL
jgi:predicted nucleic acid-binding protein